MKALRESTEPLTGDQLLELVPAEALSEYRNPRERLRQILKRPQVGHPERGRYVYLPHRLAGSVYRLPLLEQDVKADHFLCPADLMFALWYQHVDYGWILSRPTTTWRLPDGGEAQLVVGDMLRTDNVGLAGVPVVRMGEVLSAWLRSERVKTGDSLLVRIEDPEQAVCSVKLERLADRNREQVAARNRDTVNLAEQILQYDLRGKGAYAPELSGWLAAREFYRQEPPPDPLDVILWLHGRFVLSCEGKFVLPNRWEWVRLQQPDFLISILGETIPGEREGSSIRGRRHRVHLVRELRPWLEKVGYQMAELERGPTPEEVAEIKGQIALRREQIYRLRASSPNSKSAQKVLELRGDNTLLELDRALRRTLRHDTSDHRSGFTVRTAGDDRDVWLAMYNPYAEADDEIDFALADLNLAPGDTWNYVCDFGDWIEHPVTVEAVQPPAPGVTYPRQVLRPGPPPKRKSRG